MAENLKLKYSDERTVIQGKNRSSLFKGVAILFLILGIISTLIYVTSSASFSADLENSARRSYEYGFKPTRYGVEEVKCTHTFRFYCDAIGVDYYDARSSDFYLENYIEQLYNIHYNADGYVDCYMKASGVEYNGASQILLIVCYGILTLVFYALGIHHKRFWIIVTEKHVIGTVSGDYEEELSLSSIDINDLNAVTSDYNTVYIAANNRVFCFGRFVNSVKIAEAIRRQIGQYKENTEEKPKYILNGRRGRSIRVYEDRCVIKTKITLLSLLTRTWSNGEKTIYYKDVVSVQFRDVGWFVLGYLQMETASSFSSHMRSNFFNENTFLFNQHQSQQSKIIEAYISEKVNALKSN